MTKTTFIEDAVANLDALAAPAREAMKAKSNTTSQAVKDKIMSVLTYPISTEINPCGWDVRPVRRDTVEFLIEEIQRLIK